MDIVTDWLGWSMADIVDNGLHVQIEIGVAITSLKYNKPLPFLSVCFSEIFSTNL